MKKLDEARNEVPTALIRMWRPMLTFEVLTQVSLTMVVVPKKVSRGGFVLIFHIDRKKTARREAERKVTRVVLTIMNVLHPDARRAFEYMENVS
jgi:hypothetical protein